MNLASYASIAFLTLLLAATLSPSASSPALVVTAEAGPDTVRVALGAPGLARNVTVLVHHDDPIVGRTADLVAPAHVPAGGSVSIQASGIRSGHPLTIDVLPEDAVLPTVSDQSTLIDGAGIEALADLATLLVLPIPDRPRSIPLLFEGYPIIRENETGDALIHVTPHGLAVAAWMQRNWSDTGFPPMSTLRIATSNDGGHTWTTPTNISDGHYSGISHFSWAFTPNNTTILFSTRLERTGPGQFERSNPSVLTEFDLVRARIVSQRTLSPTYRVAGPSAMTSLVDRSILLVAVGGGNDSSAASSSPHVWRIAPDGAARLIASVAAAGLDPYNSPISLATHGGPTVAMMWMQRTDPYSLRPRIAWSSDDGAHWSPPKEPTGLDHLYTFGSRLDLHLDRHGTAHVLVTTSDQTHDVAHQQGSMYDNATAYYLRITPHGNQAIARPVSGPAPASIAPTVRSSRATLLVLSGPRVWIHFEEFVPQGSGGQVYRHLVESVDGGKTFGAPYATESANGFPVSLHRATVFPDGRPLFIAGFPHSAQESWLSAVPYFDPMPPLESKLLLIVARAGLLPQQPAVTVPQSRFDTLTQSPILESPTRTDAPGVGFVIVIAIVAFAGLVRRRS